MITFNHKMFVFTGRLEHFTRDQAAELVKERRGFIDTAIRRYSTDYLVVGEKPGNTKLRKAMECGTKQITEQEFAAAVLVTSPGFEARKNIVVQNITHNTTINVIQPKQRKVSL